MNQTMIILSSFTFLIMFRTCSSVDTMDVYQNITDAESISSGNENFELGFFSPGNSKNRYLGIWFKNTSPHTAVWVANRETPLIDHSGMARLDSQGILSIVNGGGRIIWSSNSSPSSKNVNQIRAQLLDTGNLVIKDENSVIWQSFDYPGDAFISGMKLGKNLITGREMYLTSWRSADDPSPGEYTAGFLMVKGKYPQLYIRKRSVIVTRIGPFDGIEFAGLPSYNHILNKLYTSRMVVNQKEMYYVYSSNRTLSLRTVVSIVTPAGKLEMSQLDIQKQEWVQAFIVPVDYCDNYERCGPYGICNSANFPNYCVCLNGYQQKIPQQPTRGCVRSRALDCEPGEGFLKFSSMKLPDTQNAMFNGSMSLQECEAACKDNCSCTAFANPNITSGGVGCLLWFGDLIDVRVYSLNGQDLYVRVEASELLGYTGSQYKKKLLTIVISASSAVVLLLIVLYACRRKKKTPHINRSGNWYGRQKKNTSVQVEDLDELPFFTLHEIAKATDNFSINNKIGEGGFGPVYKGVLEDGQKVAIKRLSETSHQGLDEFKNEVICIAKLQHRNLVKLLGYCIHENEKILIYEYMPNKSLDTFLFDETRSSMLDWRQRFNIIQGMARGILYLHQDSRLQIIHRDLKAGNILLDDDMNPKISDFGLARKFVGSDTAVMTKRVVGTHGYISPEYAIYGRFSVKSDVFSFGVLVLEIVSGKKTENSFMKITVTTFLDMYVKLIRQILGPTTSASDILISMFALIQAWRLYQEGRSIELMCPSLHGSCNVPEVLRSIHVGLLCVQHLAEDRPTMLSVVLMLVSEGVLPRPKQPAFFIGESHGQVQPITVDECTITQLYAR